MSRNVIIPLQEYNDLLAEVKELRENQDRVIIYEQRPKYSRYGHLIDYDDTKIGYQGKDKLLKDITKRNQELHAKIGETLEANQNLRFELSCLRGRGLFARIFNTN